MIQFPFIELVVTDFYEKKIKRCDGKLKEK